MRVTASSFTHEIPFNKIPTQKGGGLNTRDDILVSAQSKNSEGLFKRMICCLPRTIISIVKVTIQRVICILTLGYVCNAKLNEKRRREALIKDSLELFKVWNDSNKSVEAKAKAVEHFNKLHPNAREAIINFAVEDEKKATCGQKAQAEVTKKRMEEWEQNSREKVTKKMTEAYKNFDYHLLSNYIQFMENKK